MTSTADRLAKGPTLLLPRDRSQALLDAARLYDPELRERRGRIIFTNAVLLYGPVSVTAELARAAGLPDGVAAAFYPGTAVQSHRVRRDPEQKRQDAGLLLRGLAVRLGGRIHPALPVPELALRASVYAESDVPTGRVVSLLGAYAPGLTVEADADGSYSLTGPASPLFVGYFAASQYTPEYGPPALGELRRRQLHQWDLHGGVRASDPPRELALTVGEAALTLARVAGGIALDMFGFRFTRPDQLAPR